MKVITRLFSGDALLGLLTVLLCLCILQYVAVSIEQQSLQMQTIALIAQEGYKAKLMQIVQLLLVSFLVMCQIGLIKFPGAWSVREPFFYETTPFYESLLLVVLAIILLIYLIHLLPIYVSVVRSCMNNLWKNMCTFFSRNACSIILFICATLFSPFISWCEARNDSAFSSQGARPDGLPEEGEKTFFILIAYALRFFSLWSQPPNPVLFDLGTFALGLKLALQNIYLCFLYNIGSLIGLSLVVHNLKRFPGLSSLMDLLLQNPCDEVSRYLHVYAETFNKLPDLMNLWIVSGVVLFLWVLIKTTQK